VAWGNAYGTIEAVIEDGKRTEGAEAAWRRFLEIHETQRELTERVKRIEKHEMGEISAEQNELRLELRGIELRHGIGSPQYTKRTAEVEGRRQELDSRLGDLRADVQKLTEEMSRNRIVVRTVQGKIIPADRSIPDEPMLVAQVVRAYPANQLDLGGKLGVYFSRWREYLFDEPREANTEGGVLPAIIGTVLLTFIMIIFVVPIGVIAAIYLREYAKQGLLVSIVRISVNNLAGVPSIVFGVFGLGFFCYIIGARIDQLFFSANLPDPTVGKSAMIWASLTLALLTLPVVIVATEEALSAVPRSMREGSYACGASKWQTIRRIVLPRAMPGVMTGMILAIARGAGEVAPLMLVGAVKLAPELPLALDAPFFGSDRSFMHLGFHIYDLGFQSRNSEAAKSMVYTTTLLLIGIVVMLNIAAIFIRSRLRRAYAGGHF
jgi:phosphate transport system permease protein